MDTFLLAIGPPTFDIFVITHIQFANPIFDPILKLPLKLFLVFSRYSFPHVGTLPSKLSICKPSVISITVGHSHGSNPLNREYISVFPRYFAFVHTFIGQYHPDHSGRKLFIVKVKHFNSKHLFLSGLGHCVVHFKHAVEYY